MNSRFDSATLNAYSQDAARYSQQWLDQPPPNDLYALLETHLVPEGKTAEIGCGNGRDAAWLAAHGYDVTGFDAATGLLAEARRLHPHITFREASLPSLTEIDEDFDNVVCETVIMHLPAEAIPLAVDNLRRILRRNGMLYLSWRVTEEQDERLPDGRLYTAFEPSIVVDALVDCAVLLFEDGVSESSGKRVCRLIATKNIDES
ncbi:bifunctional 2-polyprenyl-6-hydroxyphenol methylase/3-demethylubiquinol 3-O-methyltransferase UbiG [Paraburkholderia sp. DHOC27]|uniref:class I SAM-dependent methyltransferase n=1 Tax=Paraburkholderia sp. DHOC27 TaxID=2303330 RepID=UPI000E3DDD80|nr:class I SAM-dependent methyltransferase [Paraburkholderia sp. DHOC27]RFU48057.1 class I SAM-dependent methyltransferase [Paraburkholderia sp. DHOC27]